MKLTLENFGKVKKADISLPGITVIAGPNKSGKSTIGRALMTLGTALRRMDEAVRDRKVRQFLNKLGAYLGLSDYHISRLQQRIKFDFPFDDLLSTVFWRDADNGKRMLDLVTMTIPTGRGTTFKNIFSPYDPDVIIGILQEVLKQDDLEIARDILDSMFSDVFFGQVNSLLRPGMEATLSLNIDGSETKNVGVVFKDNKLVESRGNLFASFPKIIYLEPLHLLDLFPRSISARRLIIPDMGVYDRYRAGDCSWNSILSLSSEAVNARDDLPLDEKHEIDTVLEEIGLILGGVLDVTEGRLHFRESSYPDSSSLVELENLASGMKSMTVILQVLRNYVLRRGTMFVIDEPESNLHPEWQVKFASVLVQLWRRMGVRVLVATHSPYFLKSLEISAAGSGCIGDMVSYLMVQERGGGGMLAHDVTGELNEVFKTFFDPLNNLMS